CPPETRSVVGGGAAPSSVRVEVAPPDATYQTAPAPSPVPASTPAPLATPATAPAPSDASPGTVAQPEPQIAPVSYVETPAPAPAPTPSPVVSAPAPTPSVAAVSTPAVVSAPVAPVVLGVNKVGAGSVELDVPAQTLIATPGFDVPVRVAFGYQV